jgi:hypothetical protein
LQVATALTFSSIDFSVSIFVSIGANEKNSDCFYLSGAKEEKLMGIYWAF